MLKIDGLEKTYGSFHLKCSLEVQPGSITGLIGSNGAGKSTTFKSILDLTKKDAGTITLFGKNTEEFNQLDKERIGAVLSDSGFSNYLTLSDLIPILNTLYSHFEKEKFLQFCQNQQLPMNKKLKDFSTGMKAKVKILIALSHHADFLLLDEPTSGLDVLAREEVLDLLRTYMEEDEQRSILISSHISTDLEGLCDDLYMIEAGKIILHEDVDLLLGNYGLLKMTPEQFRSVDKQYLLKQRKETYGYCALTNEKQFYMENYPGITIENGAIDDVFSMMVKGEIV